MNNQNQTRMVWTSAALLAGGCFAVYALSIRRDKMGAASSHSSCCPPGALLPALVDTHIPEGKVHTLPACATRNVPCQVYIAGGDKEEDSTSWKDKPVLIMLCDILGPNSGMHRKLADEFANRTKGIVVIPDPFEGLGGMISNDIADDITANGNSKPNAMGFNKFTFHFIIKFFLLGHATTWVKQFPWETKLEPMLKDQLVPFLESNGCSKFAMIGFCYGSWVIFKACSSPGLSKRITCGLHFHPAIAQIEKDIFGRDDLALCKSCTQPQLVHATRQEPASWKPGGAAHKLLEENPNVSTANNNLSFTLAPSTVTHGFMTRSDINDLESAKAVEAGVEMACAFLKKHNQ